MNRFIALFLFSSSLFVTLANAQCPEVSLMGPVSSVSVGEKLKFTLRVSNVENYPDLKYVWRATGGEIVSGQGTPSIEIRRDEFTTLTASVKITGVPEGCTHILSESVHIERAPSPTKVGNWKRGEIFAPLQQFQADMAIHPGDQGYIFIIRSDRYSVVSSPSDRYFLRIYRIPPGAKNPTP